MFLSGRCTTVIVTVLCFSHKKFHRPHYKVQWVLFDILWQKVIFHFPDCITIHAHGKEHKPYCDYLAALSIYNNPRNAIRAVMNTFMIASIRITNEGLIAPGMPIPDEVPSNIAPM